MIYWMWWIEAGVLGIAAFSFAAFVIDKWLAR